MLCQFILAMFKHQYISKNVLMLLVKLYVNDFESVPLTDHSAECIRNHLEIIQSTILIPANAFTLAQSDFFLTILGLIRNDKRDLTLQALTILSAMLPHQKDLKKSARQHKLIPLLTQLISSFYPPVMNAALATLQSLIVTEQSLCSILLDDRKFLDPIRALLIYDDTDDYPFSTLSMELIIHIFDHTPSSNERAYLLITMQCLDSFVAFWEKSSNNLLILESVRKIYQWAERLQKSLKSKEQQYTITQNSDQTLEFDLSHILLDDLMELGNDLRYYNDLVKYSNRVQAQRVLQHLIATSTDNSVVRFSQKFLELLQAPHIFARLTTAVEHEAENKRLQDEQKCCVM
ncbi:hypothetical protein BLNAU_5403 [Blattamonas nauphoetae]|uniref:Uncharacterized protein n=1 Tax=Blattamonas nauphoetae TaxID=2049346 RepID=A0ABQ9Y7A9_9EUKA|nr:hypothetical protein BLNAU_5403 [Blattamonas nauphoetae]